LTVIMLGAGIVMVDLQQGVFMNWFEQQAGRVRLLPSGHWHRSGLDGDGREAWSVDRILAERIAH